MLRKLRPFQYFLATSLSEAMSLLARYGQQASIMAGGTDLLVFMKQGVKNPQYVIDIKGIPNLDYISYDDREGLKIGPLATLQSIVKSPIVQERYPLLGESAQAVGILQVRNRGTVTGNLCTASPSADMPPSLLALGARLKLASQEGERVVPLGDFFAGPFETVLSSEEMVVEVQVPPPLPHSAGTYLWVPKQTAVDETLVGVATVVALSSHSQCREAHVAFASVAPMPMRARKAEDFLRGQKLDDERISQAAQVAARETSPRSRAEYRRHMSQVLTEKALHESLSRIPW
ncbi:MAG: xanthine dehydrogenase family protein subunit M [Chloroflexi bacterium]|nr:xanthine dehydrogenase family protein subunit M [Chloroflexota bacterium]